MVISDDMGTGSDENEPTMSDDDDDDDDNDDDDDDDASDRINIMDGLSAEALAALMEFQLGGNNDNTNVDDDENAHALEATTKFDKDTLCATFRPEDASQIAETLRRLHDRDQKPSLHTNTGEQTSLDNDKDESTVITKEMTVIPMSETTIPPSSMIEPKDRIRPLVQALETDGVIRINDVLSSDWCQKCSQYINQTLQEQDRHIAADGSHNATTKENTILFGNVFARDHRYDMYLHPFREKMISDILSVLLHPENSTPGNTSNQKSNSINTTKVMNASDRSAGTSNSSTSQFFDAEFHELSSLISDPGSMAQPLHPDSPYYPVYAPLWTVFIALQDITPNMGGTVVIPNTHTEEFHQHLSSGASRRHNIQTLLRQSQKYQYCRADLHMGDCIVMDSRTFHYGGANEITTNTRRTLLYFTIRNPYHQSRGYPDCNSIYPDLDGTLKLSHFYEMK